MARSFLISNFDFLRVMVLAPFKYLSFFVLLSFYLLIGPIIQAEDFSGILKGGKLGAGTAWETDYYIIDSKKPGETVLIVGGMHGNEPAGARAAEQILNWPLSRGKLVVIPRANVRALQAKRRLTPGATEETSNLNRNFPPIDEKKVETIRPRGELAGALWRFAVKMNPDWVLDLHEGYGFHRSHQPPKGKDKSVGSSVIYRASEKLEPIVEKMINAADATVKDPQRKFSRIARGTVNTGLARACINGIGAEGMILETTFNHQPLSTRTRQHRAMVNAVLTHLGLVDRSCNHVMANMRRSSGKLQVAIFDGEGTGASSFDVMNVINAADDMTLYHIGAPEMKEEVLQQFDVVLFPGGSGSKQAKDIGESGRSAVKGFVEKGGGVVGICAGAYLCSAHYSWSLDLVDSHVYTGSIDVPGKGKKPLWYRGPRTSIELELTKSGESLFSQKGIPKKFKVTYANGPIISPNGSEEIQDYEVLAWFRSENGILEVQKGTMVNTPAIVSSRVGKGRVMSVSPHPELNPELHSIVLQVVKWAAKKID